MIAAGCRWFECKTANAAMVAIASCGVKFRTIINEDGTVERWQKPRLADWEQPRGHPSEMRPLHPEVAAQRRATRRRSQERKREAAKLAEEQYMAQTHQESGPEVTL